MDVSARLRRTDLNLLIALNALVEHRHVTHAAESLGLSQSTMSASLGRLRRLFDDPLLVRSGRVLELTPMGQALVEPLHDVVLGLEHLLTASPHFDPGRDARAFTVVASDYVTLVLLRPLLEQLYREDARIAVNVIPFTGGQTAELGQAQVDLLIGPLELAAPALRRFPHRPLFTDRYVGVVWAHNRDVDAHLDRETFERLPYVQYNPVAGNAAFVDVQLAAAGIRPNVALSTLSFTLVPSLLPGTSMVAFVHERLLLASPLRRELRVVSAPVDLRPLVETMFWHPVFHADPAHRWLRERVATIAANL